MRPPFLLGRSLRWSALLLLVCAGLASPAWSEAQPVFDVTDFGANPDNGLPDNLGVRAAIAAAASQGGGIVHFPCGTYTSSSNFWRGIARIQTGENNIWLRGESSRCVTFDTNPLVTDGLVLVSICPDDNLFGCDPLGPVPENITVSGIRFRDSDPLAHAGIEESHGVIAQCRGCRFFDLAFEGIGDEGLDISHSSDVHVEDVRCTSSGVTGGGAPNAGACVNVQSSKDVRLERVHCEDTAGTSAPGSWCARIESFSAAEVIENVSIEGMIVRGYRGGGVFASATVGPIHGLSVRDSHLETSFLTSYPVLLDGLEPKTRVVIEGNRGTGSLRLENAIAPIVAHNQLEGTHAGIHVQSSPGAIVSQNVVRDGRRECVFVSAAESVSILGNRCIGMGSLGRDGIKINPFFFRAGPILIADNVVEGAPLTRNGISAQVGSGHQVTVRGNTVRDVNRDGILAQGVITGNQIQDAANAGIRLLGPDADGARVTDNVIDGTGSPCIFAEGTSNLALTGNLTRSCSPTASDIFVDAARGNQNTTVRGNDTEGGILANGPASICADNRAGGWIQCGGAGSTVTGNIGGLVDDSGPGSASSANLP